MVEVKHGRAFQHACRCSRGSELYVSTFRYIRQHTCIPFINLVALWMMHPRASDVPAYVLCLCLFFSIVLVCCRQRCLQSVFVSVSYIVFCFSMFCVFFILCTCVGYLFCTCVWGAENGSAPQGSCCWIRGSFAEDTVGAEVYSALVSVSFIILVCFRRRW